MSKFNEYLEAAHGEREGTWGTWISTAELLTMPAYQRIKALGFKLISTDRQLRNGTLMFQSDIGQEEDDKFAIYANNGAIRRIPVTGHWHKGNGKIQEITHPYILNRKHMDYKSIESMKQLESKIEWLAGFLERNLHYSDYKAKEYHDVRQKELRTHSIDRRKNYY